MSDRSRETRQGRRLRRQFEAISRAAPAASAAVRSLLDGRLRRVRIPLAILLIVGGFAGFLPVLGFWMIPLGILLLAVDVPALRPAVSAGLVRLRRRARVALGPHGSLSWLGAWLGRGR
ncbi:MAG: tryptophan synthase subunit beta [Paracoccaceae bacterium]|nr:tryptophan synthase subunit beta [Paracoccaceae bacterium]